MTRTSGQDPTSARAAELRRAFEQAFSEPPADPTDDSESLLALVAGGAPYAVRLAEIAGLFADRSIVHLPGPVPQLLGVTGLRHDVVPVYSLGGLLGHAMGGRPPRWLIVARAAQPVGFAFEAFEGYLRVPPSAVLLAKDGATPGHVPATVRLGDALRGVLGIPSLVRTIEDRIRHSGTTKEQ